MHHTNGSMLTTVCTILHGSRSRHARIASAPAVHLPFRPFLVCCAQHCVNSRCCPLLFEQLVMKRRAAAAGPARSQLSRGAATDSRFSTASASFTTLMTMARDEEGDEDVDRQDQEELDGQDDGEHGEEEDEEAAAQAEEVAEQEDEEEEDGVAEADAAESERSSAQRHVAARRDKASLSQRRSVPASCSSTSTTATASSADETAASTSSAPLSSSSLASFSAEMAATGLIYFSRLPPHMKPHKLRQLLADYGHILRVYLTPEHQSLTQRRRSTAASSSAVKRYTDGWVEFADKRVAKAVAVTLNGTTMGGRKRGYWYDDVWSCKYLKGFKWQHLTERGVMEGKGREGRRREEVGRAKREAEHYRQQMDKRKKVEAIRSRKEKQRGKQGGAGEGIAAAGDSEETPILRTFLQRPAFPGKPLED